MWCAQCRSDVATEVSDDGQSLLCTTCGGEVRKVHLPSLHPEIRSARDLLARWTHEDLLDAPTADASLEAEFDLTAGGAELDDAARDDGVELAADLDSSVPAPRSSTTWRVDSAHPSGGLRRSAGAVGPPPEPRPSGAQPSHDRWDAGHPALPAPHFDVTAAISDGRQSGKGEATWGQLLAYAGVGVLTVGTALVLWGYFGGPANYAPTGWLIATAGQMLLFLGVVTLVAGGMQQTAHEVSARVQLLDHRMIRIEESTQQILQGPHFGRASETDSQRAAAADEESGVA